MISDLDDGAYTAAVQRERCEHALAGIEQEALAIRQRLGEGAISLDALTPEIEEQLFELQLAHGELSMVKELYGGLGETFAGLRVELEETDADFVDMQRTFSRLEKQGASTARVTGHIGQILVLQLPVETAVQAFRRARNLRRELEGAIAAAGKAGVDLRSFVASTRTAQRRTSKNQIKKARQDRSSAKELVEWLEKVGEQKTASRGEKNAKQ